ncbi:MAG TPA: MerR family transcriptional regulator [Panacibacter sp.]|nr:MerR family transcriptional regulator [Panacibacter sp.]HNP45637.1 MerR family transcriptional regulator [Panacibacter sp.]
MDKFNIRDVENLTGIKAHTFRIWERRYNFLKPKRGESSHRYYDNEELKYILKISSLYHNGHKISQIVKAPQEKIDELINAGQQKQEMPHSYINRLIAASIDFDEASFDATLTMIIERFGFDHCLCHIIYPYLEKIGLLWVTNNIIPAQEHFASNLVRNKMIAMIDRLKPIVETNHNEGVTLLFSPEGEVHELPLLFAAYLHKKNNKRFIYYGTNISIREIAEVCVKFNPATLYFHLVTNFTKTSIDDYLNELSSKFPGKKIVMSGPLSGLVKNCFPRCTILRSPEENMQYISA